MKRILLSSAAIVAFAGAAAAEGHVGVSFSGDAEIGYNDDALGDNDGFYSELDVTIGFAAELDNGLTAAASIDFEDLANGGGNDGADYELSLTSETAGLFYGDTNFAAQNVWVAAGDMAGDFFSEASEVVDGAHNSTNGDFNEGETYGISVSTSFGGADVRLAYAETDDNVGDGTGVDEDSIGLSVSYPFGPVTVDASYAVNDVADDRWDLAVTYEDGPIAVTASVDETEEFAVEGSYDVGSGLVVYAGFITDDETDLGSRYYIGGEYDLGSGAMLTVSFAEDDDDADGDEIGAQEYQRGTTVELSFEF